MSSEHAQKFIEYLKSLGERDRGAFATLRRSLGFPPGTHVPAYPYVERFAAASQHPQDASRLALYVVAGLYALHPRQGEKSFATCFGEMMRGRDSASVEKRFLALLEADANNLQVYLRQGVSLLAAGNMPPALDYAALVDDLRPWLNPRVNPQWRDDVRQRWARDFYRALMAEANAADTSNQPANNPRGEHESVR